MIKEPSGRWREENKGFLMIVDGCTGFSSVKRRVRRSMGWRSVTKCLGTGIRARTKCWKRVLNGRKTGQARNSHTRPSGWTSTPRPVAFWDCPESCTSEPFSRRVSRSAGSEASKKFHRFVHVRDDGTGYFPPVAATPFGMEATMSKLAAHYLWVQNFCTNHS